MFKNHSVSLGKFALLAALAARAVLSAGEARAVLLPLPASCNAIGGNICIPENVPNFILDNFVVADVEGIMEPLFAIDADETSITLIMEESVTAAKLIATGFRLTFGTDPAIITPIEMGDLEFSAGWNTLPDSLPVVTNIPDSALATLEWTNLAGGDPVGNASVTINLAYVPEPSTAVLFGLGLTGLGLVGRRRRESDRQTKASGLVNS